jgi:hypothetical protein
MLCLGVIQGATAPCTPAVNFVAVGNSVYFVVVGNNVYLCSYQKNVNRKYGCRKFVHRKNGHRKKVVEWFCVLACICVLLHVFACFSMV